jgi:hypothetical protein
MAEGIGGVEKRWSDQLIPLTRAINRKICRKE